MAAATQKPAAAAPARRPTTGSRPVASPAKSPISYKFRDLTKESELFRMKTQSGTIINKGKFDNAQDKADFTEYYKTYVFGRWVNDAPPGKYKISAYEERLQRRATFERNASMQKRLQKEADSWNFAGFRDDFRKDLERSRDNGEPQNLAMKIAYDFAVEIITSSNSRSTETLKYNCMLLLGELYIRTSSSSQDKPVVCQPAFDFLLKNISDPKTPQYLRVGAMLSIQKFLDKEISDKQKTDVYTVFLTLAKTKIDLAQYANSKDDPTGAGAIWVRELAIKNLGLMAGVIPRNADTSKFYPGIESVTELYRVLNDANAPATTRIAALDALGSFNFHKYSQIKTSQKFLKAVCDFVIEFTQAELDRKVDPLVWGNENEMGARMGGYSEEEPKNLEKDAAFLRQRVIPVLYAAKNALTGINASKDWDGLTGMGTEEEKNKAKEINKGIQNSIKILNAKITPEMLETTDGTIMTELEKTISDIESIQESFRQLSE